MRLRELIGLSPGDPLPNFEELADIRTRQLLGDWPADKPLPTPYELAAMRAKAKEELAIAIAEGRTLSDEEIRRSQTANCYGANFNPIPCGLVISSP